MRARIPAEAPARDYSSVNNCTPLGLRAVAERATDQRSGMQLRGCIVHYRKDCSRLRSLVEGLLKVQLDEQGIRAVANEPTVEDVAFVVEHNEAAEMSLPKGVWVAR